MASKFENLWGLMSQYKFLTDPDSINDDLTCILCKSLMTDACQTACGCQYCFKCISEYLIDGDKYCPGGKDACNEEYLVMERDVIKNIRMNNRISKLRVICPNESCRYTSELSVMEDHLRICTTETSLCPYVIMGCDKLQNHALNDPFTHTQLLVDWVNNLKNEVDGLNDKLGMSELEKLSIKEKSELRLAVIIERISKQEREMTNVKQELKIKTNRIVTLEKESRSKDKRIEVLEEEFVKLSNGMESRLSMMITHMDKREKIITVMKDAYVKMEKEMNNIRKSMGNSDSEGKNSLNKKTIKETSNIDLGFCWAVDQISKNIKKTIYSDGFYLKDYKLCLSVNISVNGIVLWCYIMKGNNDDKVQWPMRLPLTLSIVNQVTGKAQRSETFQCDTYSFDYRIAFYRPRGTKNDYTIGSTNMIPYSSITNMDAVIVNDSIVVACVLDD